MKTYIGIDLGGTFIKYGLVDEEGNILEKGKVPTPAGCGYEETVRAIADAAAKLADKKPCGVGIGSPGVIDGERGIAVTSGNLGWEKVPLEKDVAALCKLPVVLTNDANAAAFGECYGGAGKSYRSLVFLTLGTGVGSGIVIDGKLFEGNGGAGAELGHMVIRTGGERCGCGRRGCYEAYASASALVKQTKKAMIAHPESKMWELCEGNADNADGRTAFDGMRLGDKAAKSVVNKYLGYLAEGIANIINIFRPETVLIGGGLSAEGETITRPLQRKVNRLILGHGKYAPVKIRAASLGNDAGLIGAAMLAKEKGI